MAARNHQPEECDQFWRSEHNERMFREFQTAGRLSFISALREHGHIAERDYAKIGFITLPARSVRR